MELREAVEEAREALESARKRKSSNRYTAPPRKPVRLSEEAVSTLLKALDGLHERMHSAPVGARVIGFAGSIYVKREDNLWYRGWPVDQFPDGMFRMEGDD